MNELRVFSNAEFGEVKTITIDNEVFFVAKETALILGYGNGNCKSKAVANAIADHVGEEDKKMLNYSQCKELFRGYQNGDPNFKVNSNGMMVINESGLYSLIFSSKLPKAKEFKRWVTAEVLPAIRKTGGYVSNDELFVSTYLPFADENTKTLFKSTLATLTAQNKMIAEMKPKVEFYDHVADHNGAMTIDEAAKVLNCGTGEHRLFKFLRKEKYLMDNNLPYQWCINRGYFRVIEKRSTHRIYKQTLITQKGITAVFKKLLESGEDSLLKGE